MRVVSSAFGTGADWEDEFWGEMETGWAPMLDNLRIYLTHFAGQRATSTTSTAAFTVAPLVALDRVRATLGVGATAEHVDAAGIGGVVEPRHAPPLPRAHRPSGRRSRVVLRVRHGQRRERHAVGVPLRTEGAAAADGLQADWQSFLDELARDEAPVPTS